MQGDDPRRGQVGLGEEQLRREAEERHAGWLEGQRGFRGEMPGGVSAPSPHSLHNPTPASPNAHS